MAKKDWKVEKVKKRGRFIGHVLTHKVTGDIIYLALRKHADMYRPRKMTLAEAMKVGEAGWTIDGDEVREQLRKGAKHVGILAVDTGDKYLVEGQLWLNPERSRVVNTGYRGNAQRLLPLAAFGFRAGPIKI